MAGMFGGFQLPQMDTSVGEPLQVPIPQPKKKGGMFGAGKGNIGEAIAAAISGYLAAGGNPAGAMGLQTLNQRRQQAMEQEQYGQRREDEFQDFVRKEAYKAANPGAVNNDTVADYNFISQVLGQAEGANYLRNRANPPRLQFVPGIGLIDASQMGGAQMGAPAAPGVTFTPLDEGGPTPPASGGFPRPY